jgi:SAM-dependent methyltransferase
MLIGGTLGYRLLRWLKPGSAVRLDSGTEYANRSKLEALLGPDIWNELRGKVVLDFGCGDGHEALDIARRGAAERVIGLDIRPHIIDDANRRAADAGLTDRCEFVTRADTKADVVLSLDAFEHFSDPAGILDIMAGLLAPNGRVFVTFGPTWLHPRGGHSFSVFPWAHLVFTERALIRWRADFTSDGATSFGTVEGGLNQITIRRFEKLVAASPLRLESLECVPIRAARPLHNRLTREFLTSFVRATLAHRPGGR